MKTEGRVKWFNAAKGYGFIADKNGRDYFLHFSAIQMEGYKSLEPGANVDFDIVTTEKGESAQNVSVIAQ